MITLPLITNCSSNNCAFNDHGCNAPAITMGKPNCITFLPLSIRGGVKGVKAEIGACQNDSCKFNENMVCDADHVEVGANHGECLTYQPR